jgi:uncharacterized membrane protein YagU involved in acid resistance
MPAMARSVTRPTPLGAVSRGLLAGVAGTVAMTGAQTAYYNALGKRPSTTPAEVAKRIIRGVLQRPVDEERTDFLNSLMHWTYGSGWGVAYGLVQGTVRYRALRSGLAFGAAVWAASLIHLPALKLAPPVWEYPPQQLLSDAGFHLIYGATTAAAYSAVGG